MLKLNKVFIAELIQIVFFFDALLTSLLTAVYHVAFTAVINLPNMHTWRCIIFCFLPVRFKVLNNNHLQIRGIKKTDEGLYTCEGRLMARGEIDLRVIKVVVNG